DGACFQVLPGHPSSAPKSWLSPRSAAARSRSTRMAPCEWRLVRSSGLLGPGRRSGATPGRLELEERPQQRPFAVEAAHHGIDQLPVIILLAGAGLAAPLATRLRVGPVLGYLAAGLVIG